MTGAPVLARMYNETYLVLDKLFTKSFSLDTERGGEARVLYDDYFYDYDDHRTEFLEILDGLSFGSPEEAYGEYCSYAIDMPHPLSSWPRYWLTQKVHSSKGRSGVLPVNTSLASLRIKLYFSAAWNYLQYEFPTRRTLGITLATSYTESLPQWIGDNSWGTEKGEYYVTIEESHPNTKEVVVDLTSAFAGASPGSTLSVLIRTKPGTYPPSGSRLDEEDTYPLMTESIGGQIAVPEIGYPHGLVNFDFDKL